MHDRLQGLLRQEELEAAPRVDVLAGQRDGPRRLRQEELRLPGVDAPVDRAPGVQPARRRAPGARVRAGARAHQPARRAPEARAPLPRLRQVQGAGENARVVDDQDDGLLRGEHEVLLPHAKDPRAYGVARRVAQPEARRGGPHGGHRGGGRAHHEGAQDAQPPVAAGGGALAAGLLPPQPQGHQAPHRGPHRPRVPRARPGPGQLVPLPGVGAGFALRSSA
mmetsp:Transcript_3656/g.10806  ORF Transcript_3656/g.10806 Transcript_3656/m.10806 type:complete len:222 (-) Transcript_3656:7-672(-)